MTRHRHPQIIGQELRDTRQALALTLDQAAELCAGLGCAILAMDISRWERGVTMPHPDRLRVLAKVLGGEPGDFLLRPRKERVAA